MKLKLHELRPYKGGDKENYSPASALSCFTKTPKRAMYNRLYLYFTENDLLYNKQFGFQKFHSNNAIDQLVDHPHDKFKKKHLYARCFYRSV